MDSSDDFYLSIDEYQLRRIENERGRIYSEINNRQNNDNERIQNFIIPYPNSELQNNNSKKDSKIEEESIQKKYNDISKCYLCLKKI